MPGGSETAWPHGASIQIGMFSNLWGCALILTASAYGTTGGSVPLQRDIEYSRVGGVSLSLDAAIPRGPGPFPAVIVVHGGGWVRGDRRVDVQPLFGPLSDAGIAWFSISYRLMTDVAQFGTAVDDVEAAIRFVKTHGAEFRVYPERIALAGESAGGQLAAMAALSGKPELQVRCVVALYAPMDLLALAKNSTYIPQWVHDNLVGSPFAPLIAARLRQFSPIEHVRRDMPPFLLIHGTADPLVPLTQSQAMCERMNSAGAACDLFTVPGAGHGIRWWEGSSSISEGYKREMVSWLRKRLAAE